MEVRFARYTTRYRIRGPVACSTCGRRGTRPALYSGRQLLTAAGAPMYELPRRRGCVARRPMHGLSFPLLRGEATGKARCGLEPRRRVTRDTFAGFPSGRERRAAPAGALRLGGGACRACRRRCTLEATTAREDPDGKLARRPVGRVRLVVALELAAASGARGHAAAPPSICLANAISVRRSDGSSPHS